VLITVETSILDALGLETLTHCGKDKINLLIFKAESYFKFNSVTRRYRFPPRRCCWLLGPKDADVLAKLGK
jgi:hypothetical protein